VLGCFYYYFNLGEGGGGADVCWWVDPNATAWSYQWPKNQLVGTAVFFCGGWGADAFVVRRRVLTASVVGYLCILRSSIHGHAWPRTTGLK
jgi:hypothetical protein